MRIRLLSVVLFTVLLTPGAVSATQVSAAQVTIGPPTAGAFVNGGDPDPYPLAAAVSGGEVASVEFFRCDDESVGCATGNWASLGADLAAPYTASWPVDTDGNRALRAVATDTADPPATSEDVVNVTVDRTGPDGQVTAPAEGSWVTGEVTVSAAVEDAVSGVSSVTFQQRSAGTTAWSTISPDADPPWSATWNTSGLQDGEQELRVVSTDMAGNSAPSPLRTIGVDQSAPAAPVLELTEGEPDEHVDGTTLYYNPNGSNTGAFTVEATAADPQSGVKHVAFPTVFGSDGALDTAAPYSHVYSWSAADSAAGPKTVTVQNGAGEEASATFTITPDADEPTGGSISYLDGYDADGSVTVTTSDGTDSGSGIAAASGVLERRTASLAGGSCGEFSEWTATTSPNTVATGRCAEYRYRVADRVGNEAEYLSSNVVKVDRIAPSAPVLNLIESTPFAAVTGNEIFVNTGETETESYTVSATTEDDASGIAKVRFPGPRDDTAPPYEQTYEFADLSGPHPVTAYDAANRTSTTFFDVTPDTAPPAGGSVSYPNGYDADGAITVSTANGTDGLAGVDGTTGVLEQDTAPLTGAACGAFPGTWRTVAKAHALAPNTCARYRYLVSDRVGNEVVYSSANVVRFDTVAPGAVTGVSATAGDHAVTLRWTRPTDPDFAAVRILRSRAGTAPMQVYLGSATSFKDTAVTNGVTYTYTLTARDRAGNRSASVSRTATPRSLYLLSPKDGAVIRKPPLLDWRPRARASYYNVQLWRGGVKILTRWPTRSQLQLRSRWIQNGRVFRLSAGKYRWLVWPGFGKPAAARYGKLLGWSEFRIPG